MFVLCFPTFKFSIVTEMDVSAVSSGNRNEPQYKQR